MRFAAAAGRLVVAASLVITGVQALSAPARADEPTVSQDLLRTGWDSSEPALSPAIVAGGSFGKLFSTQVNGQVYAQPLVAGGNVLVATENNMVYSLNGETGAINWSVPLGPAWSASSTFGCQDLAPNIGATGTPVLDPATGTLYVSAVVDDGPTIYLPHVYLFAIDEQTGAIDWKVPIQGSAANAPGEQFNPFTERQRPGLLLLGGSVYLAFASYCDDQPYSGFVAGVSTSTQALTLWSAEAGLTDNQAGIWQSGGGLMSDGPGRIFLSTGNGVSPAPGPGTSPPAELGDSVVRLGVQPGGTLAAADFFSPANAPTLDQQDGDFGSGGPVGLPFGTSTYPNLLVQAGKDGRVFLLNRSNLGGRETGPKHTDNPVSVSGPYPGQWGHPAAFAGSGGNDYVYYVGTGGNVSSYLRALKFNGANPAHPVLQDVANSPGIFRFTSGSPVVTSNGSDPASAIVWEVYVGGESGASGTLEAFDAVPQKVGSSLQLKQIWSAPIGTGVKFSVPATSDGRVYVGTRDGHVIGFGSPDNAPVSASAVNLGQVAVGSSASASVTVTANANVTIAGVSASSQSSPNPFAAGAVSLPVTLTAGQTLTVPVTFTPNGPGGATGSLQLTTDTPNFTTVDVPLSGDGTQPGLYSSQNALQFGTVPEGTSNVQQVVITNGGTGPETISATTPPSAPFTATGMPATGSAIPPGGSATVTVTYQPTAAQADSGSLSITGPDGTVTVSLQGTGAVGQGVLTAASQSVSFGNVSLGQTASATMQLSNTGNLPITINRVTAPRVPFGNPAPVIAGLTLDPGYDIVVPITYAPQSLGTNSDGYVITTSDGDNPPQSTTIAVSGTGVAATAGTAIAGPGGGWTLNGSARMSGRQLDLTTAAKSQAGSAVYYQPVPSNGLHATFSTAIGGGNGADGMTFALLDASKASTGALGNGAGRLGFGGLPGVAIALDTYKDPGDPSGNFIGIATGTTSTGLHYAATSTNVPNLRQGAHTIGVAVSGGTVTVSVDGKQRLTASVQLPPSVLPAFTGATGGLDDVHAVRAATITSGGVSVPPPGGGWSFNGPAGMSGSDTVLTQAAKGESGTVVYPTPVKTNGLTVQFTMRMGGGTGADGMTFAVIAPNLPATARGSGGSGLGFAGLSGVAAVFDTHQVTGYPTSNFAAVATKANKSGVLQFAAVPSVAIEQLRTGTHDVRITLRGGVITVYLDGAMVQQAHVYVSATALLAFTAGTGGLTDLHAIRNIAITAPR